MESLQALFDAARSACSSRAWSRGVELARDEAVTGERDDGVEVALRVSERGGLISSRVTLYLEDAEWECSCPDREGACEHVAAAAISLRRARQSGRALPAPSNAPGHVRYCLAREGSEIALEREIVCGEEVHPLRTTLEAIASGRVEGPRFVATEADLEIELTLGSRRRGVIPRGTLARLVDTLARCEDVRLDGRPIETSTERVVPHAHLRDVSGGFQLRIGPDPDVSEVFASGLALCGDTLRVTGESRLSGRELEDFARGRFYPHDEAARLVTEVLPDLRERIPVAIHTSRLPRADDSVAPRIRLEVGRAGDRLAILPTLVYGEPPRARVDAGKLVHLGGQIPVRDMEEEEARTRELRTRLGLVPGHRIELAGREAIALADRLRGWRGEIVGDAHQAFYEAGVLVPRVRIEGSRFELSFDSPVDAGDRENAARRSTGSDAVIAAWREGESLVPLAGGGLAELPANWLSLHGHRVADLLAARGERETIPRALLPDLAKLCDDLDHPRPPELSGLAPLLEGGGEIPSAAPPTDLTAALRHYQQDGVDWLCFMRDAGLGALLADDMGLGKTLQALCALRGRSLVVAPTSVLHGWAAEMRRFRPGLSFSVYHGSRRELDPNAAVTLTSYAVLRLDIETLAGVDWDCAVLDEAQNIKNPDSQVASAAYRLRAGFRLALTGTPVENRLDELWSQLHFLNPGLLGGRRDFQNRIAKAVGAGEEEAAARLRQRIRPFVLRRLKREVAPELPPRSDIVIYCELSDEERAVYDAIHAATVPGVIARLGEGGSVLEALEALLRLRQAACHGGLVPGQEAHGSSKLELLLDRVEQALAEGHRALVFSQWTSLLDRVEPELREAGVAFERLDGSTRDRAGVVARFQDESGPPILLISLRAGGTGINLTAADHVFLLDPWWNPAVEDQAADRAHRIGQSRPVLVHRLVARDTVEERLLELQERKRALAEAVLADSGAAGALTREDLLALLT